MSEAVATWWYFLMSTAVINMAAWTLSARALRRRHGTLTAESYRACRLQLLLSALYVFGCAFRSALPVYDIPRMGLVDSWLSSVIVGRSVATLAELSFAVQWALILHGIGQTVGSSFARGASWVIVPLIAIAECCSWYAVLTTSNLGHVFENSLWGLPAALGVASLMSIGLRSPASRPRAFPAWCVAGIGFVAFIFLLDVPMYWSRWRSDEAHGKHYLTLSQGLHDVATRRVISFRWEDWKSEVVWMSLYFSVGVWVSISLIRVPRKARPASAPP